MIWVVMLVPIQCVSASFVAIIIVARLSFVRKQPRHKVSWRHLVNDVIEIGMCVYNDAGRLVSFYLGE